MKWIAIFSMFLTQFTLAQDSFISDVTYNGNGCLDESAMVILSPDSRVLSLLFDDYSISAGGENLTRGRKTCGVKLKLSVPENKRVVIKKIDYRGYALVPDYSRMNFTALYNVEIPKLNFTSNIIRKNFTKTGFFDDEFVLEQTINENLTGRACGHDIVFNINTSLLAQARGEEAFVSIDSLDTGIEYHIDYEDCHSTIIRSREERRIRAEQRQEFLQNNHRNEQRRRLSQERRLRESRNIQVRASERRTNTRTQRRETQAELRAQRANRNARTAQTNRRQVIRNR